MQAINIVKVDNLCIGKEYPILSQTPVELYWKLMVQFSHIASPNEHMTGHAYMYTKYTSLYYGTYLLCSLVL